MYRARLSALALASALTAGASHAADDVMVVFDGSNSMWGQIDGIAKIEIARDAMQNLLGDWAEQTNIGLMAYGHRTRGDCNDIETIISPGAFDRGEFLARIGQITPTGKTPLTTAVEMAAQQLSYTDRPATVVLISDGIESCNRDPCALAAELERTGIQFTAHVIGFGITTEREQAALACIADETGGEFIAATNASELEEALGQVSVAVAEQPAADPDPEPEPEPTAEIMLTAPDTVTAGAEFPVSWSEGIDERDFVTIVPAGADEDTISNNLRVRDDLEGVLRAPAETGLYEIRYLLVRDRTVAGMRTIEVIPAAVTLDVPETAVAGAVFQVAWSQSIDSRDFVTIVAVGAEPDRIGNNIRVRDALDGELRAPAAPGLYEVRYVLDSGRTPVAVATLEVTEPTVNVTAPATIVAGSQFDVSWTRIVNERDFVTILPTGADDGEIGNNIRVRDDLEGVLQGPSEPGLYEVRYVLDEGRRTLAVAIVEVTEPEIALSAPEATIAGSVFDVTWGTAVNDRDFITIVPAGAGEGEIGNSIRTRDNRGGQLTAPGDVGLYEVRYVLNEGRRTLASVMIEITEPELTMTATETVRAGGEIEVTWVGQVPNVRDRITVVPLGTEEGRLGTQFSVRENTTGKLAAPEAPGVYEVRYVLDEGRRTLAAVQVEVVDASAPLDTGGSLEVPSNAVPGADVEVSWTTSSTSTRLRIALAKVDQADFTWIDAKPAGDGSSLTFTMPSDPGTYEFRLLDLGGPEVLSRSIIEVR